MKEAMLEICTNSVESCVEAQRGGASRVELCAGMPEGGTTPSYGTILLARQQISIALNVIIRPRGGDFLYNEQEMQIMLHDIRMAKQCGADGVVIGCLTPDGEVDMEQCRRLINEATPLSVTFHRAFDMCCNPQKALEDIVALGCHRILTSGQQNKAEEGIPLLRELVQQAAGRIIIMPGSGVNPQNIARIARETGATEFHLSARTGVSSAMQFRQSNLSMGGTVTISEYSKDVSSAMIIAKCVEALKNVKQMT